jgi:hypothetical protein
MQCVCVIQWRENFRERQIKIRVITLITLITLIESGTPKFSEARVSVFVYVSISIEVKICEMWSPVISYCYSGSFADL